MELEKESLVGSFAPAAGWAREFKHLADHAGEQGAIAACAGA